MVVLDGLTARDPRGIAGAIARQIRQGELAPGDRLPTVRDVAAQLGVSPATVSEATVRGLGISANLAVNNRLFKFLRADHA